MAIHAKHGPFDAAFIVGDVFAKCDALCDEELPMPTYFFFGTHIPADVQQRIPADHRGPVELAPNFLYLGSAGVVCMHGVRIVFCGGLWDTSNGVDWHAREPPNEEADDWQIWKPLDTPEASCDALRQLLRHPALTLGEARAPPPPADPGSLQQARAFQYAQAAFEFQCERDASTLAARPPVDLLLTNAWPIGMDALSEAPKPDACSAWGRAPITRLAESCRARYHITCAPAADEHGAFFEREPYEHPPFAALPPPDVLPITRFVSLARAANSAKRRWFTALRILPRVELAGTPRPHPLTASPLWVVPAAPAPPPRPAHKRHEPTEAPESGRRRRRKIQAVDPDQCWFCLSNPSLEKHLIVSVGMECYVALPKGQLPVSSEATTPVPGGGHVLIVPITHTPSVYAAESSEALRREMRAWRDALTKCYAAYDAVPVSWQVVRRGTRAGHTQTQVVPLAAEHAAAFDAFMTETLHREHGAWESETVASTWEKEDANFTPQDRQDYCYMEIGARKRLLLLRSERFNLQFPRETLANFLDMPGRADWRACVRSADVEAAECDEFKEVFAEYAEQVTG
ncbi:unnamed protein product [Malassezia sympodialis ATCC 42132]|uniref:uncharacterized protein n=1 Tax=Malassezia sympodialis (strain ATCC 42132) TaxID=1230383 RepID=UPI0002C1C344|nr:uncharacterized protein MSY001_2042 [Malassezia sympodialis ATCC 42132]CCU99336.1 unnamed protein product [Malassezia sympodialis ATCC 42132]|eukprot:XP_018740590.1 uncharacterized protein MSY001_2042 [Malassezia sympodialis ATCC 42132]